LRSRAARCAAAADARPPARAAASVTPRRGTQPLIDFLFAAAAFDFTIAVFRLFCRCHAILLLRHFAMTPLMMPLRYYFFLLMPRHAIDARYADITPLFRPPPFSIIFHFADAADATITLSIRRRECQRDAASVAADVAPRRCPPPRAQHARQQPNSLFARDPRARQPALNVLRASRCCTRALPRGVTLFSRNRDIAASAMPLMPYSAAIRRSVVARGRRDTNTPDKPTPRHVERASLFSRRRPRCSV
jgi:hypothetical protein